jgi:hypothetical protein
MSKLNKKQEIIRQHYTCTCDIAYKSRNLTDPNCFLCDNETEIELIMDEYVNYLKLLNEGISKRNDSGAG